MNRTVYRLLVTFALLLGCVGGMLGASSGEALLKRCADRIRSAGSLHVAYTVTADGQSSQGMLVVQGDRFTVSSPQMMSWYDGHTQWTYSVHIGEVNVITPTPDEVRQINPMSILKDFSTNYTVSTPVRKADGKTEVRLTSRNRRDDIQAVDLTIDDKTDYPTRIVLRMSNHQNVTIAVNTIATGKPLPEATFRFDAKKFPGVQVIDLR